MELDGDGGYRAVEIGRQHDDGACVSSVPSARPIGSGRPRNRKSLPRPGPIGGSHRGM